MMFQALASPPKRKVAARRFSVKLSPENTNTRTTRAPRMASVSGSSCQNVLTPADFRFVARCSRSPNSRLLTETDLLCACVSEETGRTHDQDDDEDKKQH